MVCLDSLDFNSGTYLTTLNFESGSFLGNEYTLGTKKYAHSPSSSICSIFF